MMMVITIITYFNPLFSLSTEDDSDNNTRKDDDDDVRDPGSTWNHISKKKSEEDAISEWAMTMMVTR
jgi:hypothetical protein